MSLTTSIYFLDHINPYETFHQANLILGNEAPIVLESHRKAFPGDYVGLNIPSHQLPGIRLHANFTEHFPLATKEVYDRMVPDYLVYPACWSRLTMDVSYDYRDGEGGAVTATGKFLVGMHEFLSERGVGMMWREYNMTRPKQGLGGLQEFFELAESQQEWFDKEVLPKYEAMFTKD